ncbi:MAG: BsuPI-related putative proteinase inhibitor [Lawsonella sp.]
MESKGPLPPEIYRRRRIGAIVIAVVVIALLIWGIVALVGGNEEETNTGRSTVTVASTSTITNTDSPSEPACEKGDLTVLAQLDQDVVEQGKNLPLIMKVTNSSDKACTAQLGAAHQRYEIYTKADNKAVWKSEICYTSDQNKEEVLQPGESRRYTVNWEGTRKNADGNCTDSAPRAEPGEYELYTVLNAQVGEPVTFQVVPKAKPSPKESQPPAPRG